jgi:FtsP/CotA-like multicopper oxidase with cupredoxin domain
MKTWLSILSSLGVLFALIAISGTAGNSAPSAAHASPCGPAHVAFAEPPGVNVWTLPKNDLGQHELILAVHQDKDRFCYHYRQDGAEHIGAPAIHVRPGDTFAVRVVNDMASPSKGERVAASALPMCMPMAMDEGPVQHYVGYLNHTIDDRYMNASDADVNLHLHGFQGPESQDDPFLSTLSTPMHACEYHFTIPANQPPGTYFYHPHAHGAADDQVGGGLAGAWIVDAPAPRVPAADDHLLILGYRYPFANDNPFAPDPTALIFDAGSAHEAGLRSAAPVAYDPFNPPPWPSVFPMRYHGLAMNPNDCDGIASDAALSINGALPPGRLTVAGGDTQVLRLVNATADSPKLFVLRDRSGNAVPLKIVELDGRPVGGDNDHPLSRYIVAPSILVPPSGRASVLVTVAPGAAYTLSTQHFCAGTPEAFQMAADILSITGADSAADPHVIATSELLPGTSPAAALVAYADAHRATIYRRAITFSDAVIPKQGKTPVHLSFFITDTTNKDFHEHPFAPVFASGSMVPTNPDIVVKQGTVEEWYLINASMGGHAFHIHQMSFVNEHGPGGVPVSLDTVYLPQGRVTPNASDPNYPLVHPSIVRVLIDFRHVPKGTFVFHCHMLYHEDHGMMGSVRVE